MQETEWRKLIYQGRDYGKYYLISSNGCIKSAKTNNVIKLFINKAGYYQCCISAGSRTEKKTIKIHKAIAEAFIQNPNNYPVVNHIDGNKLNNSLDNLEWCTVKRNTQHAFELGLIPLLKGELNGNSKLTEEDILFIRNNYIPRHNEFGTRAMARKFGVDHALISRILSNQKWKHIQIVDKV